MVHTNSFAYSIIAWTLRDRLLTAASQHEEHDELFKQFTGRLDAQHVADWTAQIVAWERDQTLPDPYQVIALGKK